MVFIKVPYRIHRQDTKSKAHPMLENLSVIKPERSSLLIMFNEFMMVNLRLKN